MIRTLFLAWLMGLAVALPAQAHDPFDGATEMIVLGDRIELTVTLGSDAARAFARTLGLAPAEAAKITRSGAETTLMPLPLAAAARLMQLETGGRLLAASHFAVAPNENEIMFQLTYPRPGAGTLVVRASYFDITPYMREGTLVVADRHRKLLATALLSNASRSATVPLQSKLGAAVNKLGFTDYVALGVQHILTGFDHLLFLAALLIGARKIRPMLIIITSFTLAHSITLALAALDLVVIPPSIVEPLIAASIIVVGIDNLRQRDSVIKRYWMAGVFGLIHGVGFAGILRDTALAEGGASIVLPLLGFNLGVETGQLLVAAIMLPLLLLWRRQAPGRQSQAMLSTIVIAISSVWLVQRLGS